MRCAIVWPRCLDVPAVCPSLDIQPTVLSLLSGAARWQHLWCHGSRQARTSVGPGLQISNPADCAAFSHACTASHASAKHSQPGAVSEWLAQPTPGQAGPAHSHGARLKGAQPHTCMSTTGTHLTYWREMSGQTAGQTPGRPCTRPLAGCRRWQPGQPSAASRRPTRPACAGL